MKLNLLQEVLFPELAQAIRLRPYRLFVLVFSLAILLPGGSPQPVYAQSQDAPVLVLNAEQPEYLVGKYVEYLEDRDGKLTFEQVNTPQYATKFTPSSQNILNFGLSESVYWLRLRVRNEAPERIHWRLELARPSMNTVALYMPAKNGGGIEKETGYIYPFATRDIPHELFVFHLSIAPGAEQTIFLKVKDKSMDLPLRIWQSEAMEQRDQTAHLLVGLSFGALLIMFIYNLFLTVMLWDRGYLYYSFCLISLIFYMGSVQAYLPRYLWPNQTAINTFVIPFSVSLGLISILLFAGEFLQIKTQPRAWRIPHRLLLSVLIGCGMLTPFLQTRLLDAILFSSLIAFIYIPCLALRAWMHGYKPARFYLISWTVFFVAASSVILESMGVFTVQYLIPEQQILFGGVYLVAFQAIALADRFNLYKQETISAQAAVVEHQQEALKLKDTLAQTLEQAREELEQKVAERTQELTEVNQLLAKEVVERKRAQREADLLARTDPLTDLFNRRHFSHLAEQEFKKAARYNHPIALLIFDIDLFKNVNDTFGHQTGDKALVHIARVFQQKSRRSDILARYGGEEFIALLPETDSPEAYAAGERLRMAIQGSPLHTNHKTVELTISVGVAGMRPSNVEQFAEHFEELLKEADEALYRAKNSGRNRVVIFEQKPSPLNQ